MARKKVPMPLELDITLFRLGRPGISKVLGNLEAEVMELIWARPVEDGTTVRDIFEILYPQRHLAYTTVMTTMTRLAKKQLLQVEKREQTYIYTPTLTRQAFISHLINRVLEDLLVSFVETAPAEQDSRSDHDASAHFQKLLDEITRRRAMKAGQSCT
jgi:predicted transcriptional regulator